MSSVSSKDTSNLPYIHQKIEAAKTFGELFDSLDIKDVPLEDRVDFLDLKMTLYANHRCLSKSYQIDEISRQYFHALADGLPILYEKSFSSSEGEFYTFQSPCLNALAKAPKGRQGAKKASIVDRNSMTYQLAKKNLESICAPSFVAKIETDFVPAFPKATYTLLDYFACVKDFKIRWRCIYSFAHAILDLHRNSVMHGDIKIDNALMMKGKDKSLSVALCDLNQSQFFGEVISSITATLLHSRPPEASLKGFKLVCGPSYDVWSFANTILEILGLDIESIRAKPIEKQSYTLIHRLYSTIFILRNLEDEVNSMKTLMELEGFPKNPQKYFKSIYSSDDFKDKTIEYMALQFEKIFKAGRTDVVDQCDFFQKLEFFHKQESINYTIRDFLLKIELIHIFEQNPGLKGLILKMLDPVTQERPSMHKVVDSIKLIMKALFTNK